MTIAPAILVAVALLQAPSAPRLEETGRMGDLRVRESSGVAVSRRNEGVLWTHNDSGHGPYLYATNLSGSALGRLRVTGAVAVDWEDIASGPCPDNLAESCLYIADTGDNLFLRPLVTVYAIRDPTPPVQASERAMAIAIRYPDGPRDVEAMFVDDSGTVHFISKGNRGSIDHYAVSRTEWGKQTVISARHIQTVGVRATRRRLITGAALGPTGRVVALRTRRFLYLFTFDNERLGDEPLVICASDLPSGGEAVDFLNEEDLVLTDEVGESTNATPIYRLRCAGTSSG